MRLLPWLPFENCNRVNCEISSVSYCCSCVLFSRDPRRFFGLIYCRFVSLASDFNAFFTPGGSVSLAHREIRARSRVGGSLGSGNPVSQRSGSCNPRVRDRVLLASSLLSALASKAKWCQPTRWDGPFGWPGWLLSQRVFIPFFSLLPLPDCVHLLALRPVLRSPPHWKCKFFSPT